MRILPSSMPSSDMRSGRGWRGVLIVAAGTCVTALALVAARVVWFDAYWLYRERPPWLALTNGANRLLDRQTRRAKILQALTRPYTIALVGSSTVYHGLDPQDADPALRGQIFNVGISALMADELPLVASVVASRRDLDRVVIGLDYYMFSRRKPPVALDPDLASRSGRWTALMGSVISRYAIMDSTIGEVAGGEDPGSWTYAGFRITPKLPPALTRENDMIRRRTAAAYHSDTLDALHSTLALLVGHDVEVYLSPVSDAQRRVLADEGFLADFARWRSDVAEVAARHGVEFADVVDLGSAFPFDPAGGSTDQWLDNLHYTPALGRRVLQEVRLRSPTPFAPTSP
jgi:hypothetical protein